MEHWTTAYVNSIQEAILNDYAKNGYWDNIPENDGALDYFWLQMRPLPWGHGDETKDSVFLGPYIIHSEPYIIESVRELLQNQGKKVVFFDDTTDCPDCKWQSGAEAYSCLTPCLKHCTKD